MFRTLGRRDGDGGVRCVAALGRLRMRRRAGLLVGDRLSGTEISLCNRTGQAYRYRGLNGLIGLVLCQPLQSARARCGVMPITQFLDSPEFDPETKRVMDVAFEMARAALQLGDQGNLINERIAKRIIELAKTGEADPNLLCECVLREFRQHL